MKKLILSVMFAALSLVVVPASAAEFGLIPLPVSAEKKEASAPFVFSKNTCVVGVCGEGSEGLGRAVEYFLSLRENEFPQAANASAPANRIVFKRIDDPSRIQNSPEGYVLDVSAEKITIEALDFGGFFYAVQTLRQLTSEHGTVPACTITDFPRFAWRGFMLDSVRHFQSVEWIKSLIDLLASQKINTLHWHLTDDQGWRIEIKKFPELTARAAWRSGIGFGLEPQKSTHYDDAGRYGGFYSQDEIREIVAYAARRNITIVPEIELPGHAVAALTAFPQLGCTGGPYEIWMRGGVSDDVFCAGNDAVFEFLEAVFDEVAELFPGKFIHVGGDECPKIRWENCPKCQARMRAENLKNEHELQSRMMRRTEKYLAGKGRRIIGWDEILEGGLAPNAAVMSWRGAFGGIAAAKLGHDVVMAPNSHCYFDYSQARSGESRSAGGFIPLERAYEFNPTEGVPAEFQAHVLGGQANLWTEYIPNEKRAEYMIAPRISALAEATWTPLARRSWDDFRDRMLAQYARFEKAGINYCKPDGVLIRARPDGVEFSPDLKNAPVVYTLDGTVPTLDSPRATAENYVVKIPESAGPMRVRARAVLQNGELGREFECRFNLPKAKVVSTLGTSDTHFPDCAADGSRAAIYWSDGAVRSGDAVTAFFEKPQTAQRICVLTGKNENGGGGDRLQSGVLEISDDGKTWREIAKFENGIAVADLPAGTYFSAVRIRATGAQHEWLIVREIELD